MRWVWLTTRYVRLSLSQQYLFPTIGAPLLRSSCAHRLLHGLQNFPTWDKPRKRLPPLEAVSCRRQLPLIEEQAGIEHGKPPVNASELLETYKQPGAKEDAEAVQEGYTPNHSKNDVLTTVAEHADSTKLTRTAKVEEHPNASDATTVGDDPHIQSRGRTLACRDYNPAQQSLATTSSDGTSFSIDGHGQLRIKSTTAALRKSRTALVVSSVSRNLLEADFTRLLARRPEKGNDKGGFMRAIPGRDTDFNRLSYWILLFDSPYTAASFQHRLRWYHANAMLNLPVNPYTAATTNKRELTPPEGYVDPMNGEDTWKRLHEFSILLSTQFFDVTAIMEPFPELVHTTLRNHELWKFPNTRSEAWPVRIWIDDHHLEASFVKRFLEDDGNARGHEWKLTGGNKSVEPMFYTAFNNLGDRIDRKGGQMSKDDVKLLRKSPQKSWVIRFRKEGDALLFWRTWHRKSLPESLSQSPGENRLLHVDPLW